MHMCECVCICVRARVYTPVYACMYVCVSHLPSQIQPDPPPSVCPGDTQEELFSSIHEVCWPSIKTVHSCQLEKIYNQQKA